MDLMKLYDASETKIGIVEEGGAADGTTTRYLATDAFRNTVGHADGTSISGRLYNTSGQHIGDVYPDGEILDFDPYRHRESRHVGKVGNAVHGPGESSALVYDSSGTSVGRVRGVDKISWMQDWVTITKVGRRGAIAAFPHGPSDKIPIFHVPRVARDEDMVRTLPVRRNRESFYNAPATARVWAW